MYGGSLLKAYSRHFVFFARSLDVLVAFLIWITLYHFRFYYIGTPDTSLDRMFYMAGALLAGLTSYFFNKKGLYNSQRMASRGKELWTTFEANAFAVIVFVVLLYFFAEARLSRFVILSYFVFSTSTFLIIKFSVRSILRSLRRRGHNLRSTLLIGHNSTIEDYVKAIQAFTDSGVYFLGWIDSGGLAEKYGIKSIEGELKAVRRQLNPDYIVLGYEWSKAQKVEDYLKASQNDVVPFVILPDMTYSFVGVQMESLAGVPAIIVNQPKYSSLDMGIKRFFDFILSAIALVLLSPFLFIIGILIKIDSKGPIFYRQDRLGLDGRKFKMIKFRTMNVDPNDPGYGWTVEGDPRRTKLGAFLRATSIDELPQLFNVLVGSMSLVGPRPEMVYYVEKHRGEIPTYMLRHKVKVGITGWAQVNGWRGDTCMKSRIDCDLYYIQNWSLWLDIKIVFLTLYKGLVSKNAY